MNFNIIQAKIPGCFKITFNQLIDHRGSFTKTFHKDIFKELGINLVVAEEYFTYSVKNVFRGLHLQIPPMALDKSVYCISGKMTNFMIDLRKGSPTFKEWVSFDLDGNIPSAIFIPEGVAHGFHVKSDHVMMQYKVSKVYSEKFDTGISYKTFDFAKSIVDPIISERDLNFSTMDQFETPFEF